MRKPETLQLRCRLLGRNRPEPRRNAEMSGAHACGVDAGRWQHLVADEVRVDEDGLRAIDRLRQALLEPPHAVGGMRLREPDPRKVVDRDDDGHLVREGDVVRLVVQLDTMSPQAAGKPEIMRGAPDRAADRDERLDAIEELEAAGRRLHRGRRGFVTPAVAIERVGVDCAARLQRGTELDDVVADSGDGREQRRGVERDLERWVSQVKCRSLKRWAGLYASPVLARGARG